MKKIPVLALLFVLMWGCSQRQTVVESIETEDAGIAIANLNSSNESLNESYRKWNNLKGQMGISYQYTRSNASGWGGLKNETTLTVRDDFVKRREYMVLDKNNEVKEHWIEDGFSALKDHNDGAPIKRIDDLYEDCANLLEGKDGVEVTFDAGGILQSCHYGKRGIFIENLFFIRH